MNYDYSQRGYLLPAGCKDLGDVLKLTPARAKIYSQPPRTNEDIRRILRKYVPEIAAGVVEIVSVARNVGHRCLLVVRSLDPKVSAVRACSFQRGERQDALLAELGGEFPSIHLWQPTPEDFIITAFLMAQVDLDSATRQAIVTIHPSQQNREQIVRINSELVDLVAEVTGWQITLAGTEKS